MINFVLSKSGNYGLVQQSLLTSIATHLDRRHWTASIETARPGCLNFSLFVRQPAHVIMSHGVADKNYFTAVNENGELYANRLRALFVPGAWLKRKLVAHPDVRVGSDRIHIVGWPRLDLLRQLARSRPQRRTFGRRRILWAPTHDCRKRGPEQLLTSSYPAFAQHVPALERDFEVSVSVHPRNRPEKKPTDVALLDADVVISDCGTLVYEAWALGKPVIFPRWILGDRVQEYLPGSAEAHILESRLGYHPSSMEELVDLLHRPLAVGAGVEHFMRDYIDDDDGVLAGVRVARLLESLDAAGLGDGEPLANAYAEPVQAAC